MAEGTQTHQLNVGDVVHYANAPGCVSMLIVQLSGEYAVCVWFTTTGSFRSEMFGASVLVPGPGR